MFASMHHGHRMRVRGAEVLCCAWRWVCERGSAVRQSVSKSKTIRGGAALLLLGGCVAGYRPALDSPDPAARIRAIRQVTAKQDHNAIPLLVDRLEDEDEAVRFYAIGALSRMTGTDMGYKYYQPRRERLPAVRRWRQYVRQRSRKVSSTQTASSER